MSNSGFNNLAALMNAVFIETNRPDLIFETANAVFSSTLKMHGIDFFPKDIKTAQLKFDSATYIQTLDTVSLPFYRAMAYIRKDDPTLYAAYEANPNLLPPLQSSFDGTQVSPSIARALLTEITPDDLFDEYGAEKYDVWYQAGNTVFIRSATALLYGLCGWYGWPNLDVSNANLSTFSSAPSNSSPAFNSWIADEFPWAIIFDAASSLLQKIGQTDAARKYDQLADPRTGKGAGLVWSHINNLILANIRSTGR